MAGQPPSPQQGQPQPGAQGGQPPIPPEMLMALLAHLMTPQGQQGGQPPKDGSQTSSLGDLMPQLLQALMGPQQPPAQGQQQGGPQQKPQQPGAKGPAQQGQPQQNPLASILQSLGIKLQ